MNGGTLNGPQLEATEHVTLVYNTPGRRGGGLRVGSVMDREIY